MDKKQDNIVSIVAIIFLFKVLLALFFDSEINKSYLLPFIDHFIATLDDPYASAQSNAASLSIPPFMLYVLSVFRAFYNFLAADNLLVENILFKAPLFLSDITILLILFNLFPGRKREAIFFYYLNPIVIYSSFMMASLDLMPIALVFGSAFLLLKDRVVKASVCLGCAISLNLYAIFSIPISIIYLLMRPSPNLIPKMLVILLSVYVICSIPYIISEDFVRIVLLGVKETFLTSSFVIIGDSKLYLALIGVSICYAAFFRHKKINQDLLFSFYGILFSLFVILINLGSGGYLWFVPFLSSFFINYRSPDKNNVYFYISLSLFYIIYFVIFNGSGDQDLKFLNSSISFSFLCCNSELSNVFFTILESLICINVFIFYKYAVSSNDFYKNKQTLTVGIGGDSGTGKSKLLLDLKSMFKTKLLELEGDGDHKWERGDKNWEKLTHLNPKANYIYEQAAYIKLLKEGKRIFRKEYNHVNGTFTEKVQVDPKKYIVLCGLHPFYLPKLRKILDLKIYMDTDEQLRKHWKILRDTKKRGYSNRKILEQIEERKIDSLKYIAPQKQYADFIINYFSEDTFKLGDSDANPLLKLKVIFDADLQVENLVGLLEENGIKVEWDYLDNLEKQFLLIHNKPPEDSVHYLKQYLLNHVVNIEELIDLNMDVQWGYRGVIQVLILKIVSLQLKAGVRV